MALAEAIARAEAAEASVEASKQALKASEGASEEALTLQTSKAEVKMADSRAAAEKVNLILKEKGNASPELLRFVASIFVHSFSRPIVLFSALILDIL